MHGCITIVTWVCILEGIITIHFMRSLSLLAVNRTEHACKQSLLSFQSQFGPHSNSCNSGYNSVYLWIISENLCREFWLPETYC